MVLVSDSFAQGAQRGIPTSVQRLQTLKSIVNDLKVLENKIYNGVRAFECDLCFKSVFMIIGLGELKDIRMTSWLYIQIDAFELKNTNANCTWDVRELFRYSDTRA